MPWTVAWSEAMPLVRADISTVAVTSSGYSTSAWTWSGTSAAIGPSGPGRSAGPSRVTAVTASGWPSQRVIASARMPRAMTFSPLVARCQRQKSPGSEGPLASQATWT